MRWRVAVSTALILLMVLGGILCRKLVEHHCRSVERLLQTALSGDEGQLEQAQTLWENHVGLLSTLIDHEKLERIGEQLTRAEGYLKNDQSAAAADRIYTALYLLDGIREYDHMNLKNLF